MSNPGNEHWQARKNAAFARGQGNLAPVFIDHAENAEMWDVEGSTPKKTIFVTTGAEAVENSVKIARAHTGRRGVIGDIRASRGAMIAMELVKNGDAEQPDADLTKALVTLACQRGLVLLSCGIRGNVIRFLPALTISDELIYEGLDIVAACFRELC